jgi:hypothetical protein
MDPHEKPSARDAIGMPIPPSWASDAGARIRNIVGRAHGGMVPPFALILERLFGIIDNKMLAVAVELEIPDLLFDGPRTAQELAASTGADADALNRVLRFLVSRDLLGIAKDGRYENNRVSDLLRKDHPYGWRGWVEFFGSDWNWTIWNHALHSVMTGESAVGNATGAEIFDYLGDHNPSAGAAFNEAMAAGSRMQTLLVDRAYDFSNVDHVCDVGGGTGSALSVLLQRHPGLRGTLFELSAVASAASEKFEVDGVADRCEIVAGNFFESVPEGADVYLLFAVVHDWGDEEAAAILGNVRRAMKTDSRALVVEGVVPEGREYNFAKVSDLLMLIFSGSGRERTKDEFDDLFAKAGLATSRVIKLPSLFRIFELSAQQHR